MTGACPSCGVAVIPGYVKCPRCHAVLPQSGRLRRATLEPGGGTSVAPRRAFPLAPALVVAAALAVVLFLVLGGAPRRKPSPGEEAASALVAAGSEAQPAGAAPAGPAPPPGAPPAGSAPPPGAPPAPAGSAAPAPPELEPSPAAAAAELARALGRQRLWSSVQSSGARVDVRSGSCDEPAMGPVIDAARAALRGAGLTRLRCLAQSGAVVFERDL